MVALALVATPAASAQPRPDARAPEHKSGEVATGLAIGGTLAGFGLMAAGGALESESLTWTGLGVALVGPSAGHIYAGEGRHALVTSSLRAGSFGMFAVGFSMSFCIFDCEDKSVSERRNGELLAFGGLGLYVATTLYDIVDAHQATRRANRAAAAAAPAVLTSPDGNRAPGMVLTGAF